MDEYDPIRDEEWMKRFADLRPINMRGKTEDCRTERGAGARWTEH